MTILDLGCGGLKMKGAIGVDKYPIIGVDAIVDLAEYPYPFANDVFDEVYLNDIIEHLPNTIATMEEIYRISKPNAKIFIRVINWNSEFNSMDPTHVKAFGPRTFEFFGHKEDRMYYTHARFNVEKIEYNYCKKAIRHFRFKWLLKFLSQYLNNVLEDMHFELRVIKKNQKMLTSGRNHKESLFDIARCPYCIGNNLSPSKKMKLLRGLWLVCENEKCNRKYPIYKGLSVLTREEGSKWRNVENEKLPPNGIKIDMIDYPKY